MSKMKLQVNDEISPYHAKWEQWNSRELQLNMLHEEIINKREALLRTSRNFLKITPKIDLPINNTEASIRNERLRKNIAILEETINESFEKQKSPRFTYLQANYWSMVKNMFPIWKKSLTEAQLNTQKSADGRGTSLSDLDLV